MRKYVVYFVLGFLLGLWLSERLAKELALSQPLRRSGEDANKDESFADIKGIGPVFERALHSAGITTHADLARQDADALASKLGGRITGERIRRERWIEQARERLNS